MFSTEEVDMSRQFVKTAPAGDPFKSFKPNRKPTGSKCRTGFPGKKHGLSKRFSRKTVVKGEHCESTQQRRKQDDLVLEDKHAHCRNVSQTLLGGRVLRNRRSRRVFDENRHTKRLFTPEIKKYLKDWLIRRREHPYPNREEKKNLAVQTGLTYIQICNWFANWRRKLKNAGSEDQRTWSHLIKSYNTQAEGNAEQISITSDDSIWERRDFMDDADDNATDDEDLPPPSPLVPFVPNIAAMDHCYSVLLQHGPGTAPSTPLEATTCTKTVATDEATVSVTTENQPQCFTISSTTTEDEELHKPTMAGEKFTFRQTSSDEVPLGKNKYKRHIMEKYMNDLRLGTSLVMDVGEKNWKKEGSLAVKRQREGDSEVFNPEWGEQHRNSSDRRNKCGWHDAKKRKVGAVEKAKELCPPVVLSKWLESTAKFKPTKSYVPWTVTKNVTWPKKSRRANNVGLAGEPHVPPTVTMTEFLSRGHQREELDAAEALTCLSGSRR